MMAPVLRRADIFDAKKPYSSTGRPQCRSAITTGAADGGGRADEVGGRSPVLVDQRLSSSDGRHAARA